MLDRIEAEVVQQRWEYLCQRLEGLDNMEESLNHLGEERWELACIIDQGPHPRAVFKRPQRLYSNRPQASQENDQLRPRFAK